MKKIALMAVGVLVTAVAAHAADVDGKKVYGAKCAMCHGLDGKGKAAMAKVKKVAPAALDLTKDATQDKSQADLVKITTEGTKDNKMPAMKGKMTDAEIDAAVAYAKTLGAAPAKAEKKGSKK